MNPLIYAFLCLSAVISQSSSVQQTAGSESRFTVSPLAPDLTVVTEISHGEPYIGQQFSIIYRLRAQRPPAAVDINPQQYPGFWTELVPIDQESATTARPVTGRKEVEYLLRQVIAYPLAEGALQLPPLSLKIKRTGSLSSQLLDWDVEGSSAPVGIRARAAPAGPDPGKGFPFVGQVQGELQLDKEYPSSLVLEIQGTANLAFFQPFEWMNLSPGLPCRATLASSDDISRTFDSGGKRQLSLLQRQRWILSFPEGFPGPRSGEMVIPVLDPQSGIWGETRIAGIQVRDESSTMRVHDQYQSEDLDGFTDKSYDFLLRSLPWIAGIAVLAITIFLARRLRLLSPKDESLETILASLKRKPRISARSFLDAAHKILERHAESLGRSETLGARDTALDRCWLQVQSYRFSKEILPAQVRGELIASMRQILLDKPEESA